MGWRVPSASPLIDDDDIAAVTAVLRSGVLANGPQAAALEEEFAAFCGVAHAAAVSSGTAALVLAGQSLGLAPGDTVLVPGFTFAATANAFLSLGCRVVPVDVDRVTMNVSARALEAAISEWEPRAAVVVDLFGSTTGTDEAITVIRRAGAAVVEDGAQAHGASGVGARADATAFSLYATKNMAAGEGGLVTTPHQPVDAAVRRLRNHGSVEQYRHETPGLNHRMPEMEAALARRQLLRLRERNERRRALARELAGWCKGAWGDAVEVPPEATAGERGPGPSDPLSGRPGPSDPLSGRHVFHQFTVRFAATAARDTAAEALRAGGVDARQLYPYTIGELPGVEPAATPNAARLRDTVLSLPVHPGLDDAQWSWLRATIASVTL